MQVSLKCSYIIVWTNQKKKKKKKKSEIESIEEYDTKCDTSYFTSHFTNQPSQIHILSHHKRETKNFTHSSSLLLLQIIPSPSLLLIPKFPLTLIKKHPQIT